MTGAQLLTMGATWLWQVALHSFLMGLVFFAWTRSQALAPGRSRRWLLSMILVFPLATATVALLRRLAEPESAWFDSFRLLRIPVAGGYEVAHLVAAVAIITAVMTLLQEVIPSFFPPKRSDHEAPSELLETARAQPGWQDVEVIMIHDHLAAAAGGTPARPKLYLSASLAESLEQEEMHAVVRHEHAHLIPSRWWWVHLLYAARLVQIANPFAMWVSREYGVETEIACDAEAVGEGGDPRPLARVLFDIYEAVGGYDSARRRVLQRRIDILLGRSGESHRLAQLPSTSLLLAGALMAVMLSWVI